MSWLVPLIVDPPEMTLIESLIECMHASFNLLILTIIVVILSRLKEWANKDDLKVGDSKEDKT